MTLKDQLAKQVAEREKWEIRRQFGADGPNMRHLWVLACMDERLPVDEALGIRADTPVGGGDAHLFRNAGGIVTDDAIRSAMLTINFFGTNEIVVLQHTGCGMLSANGNDLEAALRAKGIDVDNVPMDPTLPEMTLKKGAFAKWIGMMDDVDETCLRTVEAFRNHPLIPKSTVISGWVWETEFRRLRAPNKAAPTRSVSQPTAAQMKVKGKQPPRWG
jgi:carbonic anhydrase